MQTDISVDSKHQTLQGVAFPLHRDAVAALKRYKDKMINYVQLVSPCRVTYGGGYLFNERLFVILRWPRRSGVVHALAQAARSPKQGVDLLIDIPRLRVTRSVDKGIIVALTQLSLGPLCSFYPSMVSFSVKTTADSGRVARLRTPVSSPPLVYGAFYPHANQQLCDNLSSPASKQIDADQELIHVCSTEPTEVKDLPKRIPKDSPRYHFFLYKHSHEGDYLQSTGEPTLACGRARLPQAGLNTGCD